MPPKKVLIYLHLLSLSHVQANCMFQVTKYSKLSSGICSNVNELFWCILSTRSPNLIAACCSGKPLTPKYIIFRNMKDHNLSHMFTNKHNLKVYNQLFMTWPTLSHMSRQGFAIRDIPGGGNCLQRLEIMQCGGNLRENLAIVLNKSSIHT